MAINPETQYPGKTAPSTSDYPYGSARNVTLPGDGTGTPWEAALVNDLFGFFQSCLSKGGVVPSGSPDTAQTSQILESLTNTIRGAYRFDNVASLKSAQYLKEGDKPSSGATTWKVLAASANRGVTLGNGLKAISLNGLWIDDFGCVADGEIVNLPGDGTREITGTDNTDAYKSAVDAFLAGAGKSIMAGYGQYNFAGDAILSYTNGLQGLQGYTLKGQGGLSKNTNFVLVTNNDPKWFYQNGENNRNYQFMKIEGVCFGSDSLFSGGFFNPWSNGHEQGFSFYDVRVEWVNEVNHTEGTANASEFKWFGCKFNHINSATLVLDNQQSVNHEYYGCDAEVQLGDVIQVRKGGGGSVKWFGGSVILSTYGSLAAKEGAIVRIDSSAGSESGTGNQDFTFNDIKTELKDVLKRVFVGENASTAVITCKILNSNMTTVSNNDAREAVLVKRSQIVRFDNCEMPPEFSYKVDGTNEAQIQNGLIEFENTKDTLDLASRCSVDGFFGAIRGRELVFTDTSGSGDSPNYATDFDINFTNNGRGAYSSVFKSASLLQNRLGWPYNSGNEQTLIVPDNCTIRNIYVYRPARGGSTSAYTLKIGSNDKSIVYGQSTTADQRLDHSFEVLNLNLEVEEDANLKSVRLWADGGTDLLNGEGYVVVEYV